VAAVGAGTAGVPWRHGNEVTTAPRQFVIQLAAELEPALIENRLVQTGFSPDIYSRLFPL